MILWRVYAKLSNNLMWQINVTESSLADVMGGCMRPLLAMMLLS